MDLVKRQDKTVPLTWNEMDKNWTEIEIAINEMTQGSGGVSLTAGTGAPAPGFGNKGDFYIDKSTGDFYEKKDNGMLPPQWVVIGNISGGSGSDGVDAIIEVGGSPMIDWTNGRKAYRLYVNTNAVAINFISSPTAKIPAMSRRTFDVIVDFREIVTVAPTWVPNNIVWKNGVAPAFDLQKVNVFRFHAQNLTTSDAAAAAWHGELLYVM